MVKVESIIQVVFQNRRRLEISWRFDRSAKTRACLVGEMGEESVSNVRMFAATVTLPVSNNCED